MIDLVKCAYAQVRKQGVSVPGDRPFSMQTFALAVFNDLNGAVAIKLAFPGFSGALIEALF